MSLSNINIQDYPTLSNPVDWGVVNAKFSITNEIDESIVSNVSIIPFIGDHWVIFQIDNGMWELPGGTLEKGERYYEALSREVMEELGAELISYNVFGRFDCETRALKPYKPHLPFPKFVRLLGYGEVKLVREPLNPDGGEKVICVEAVEINEAIRRFEGIGRYDIAELYRLAYMVKEQNELE